MYTLVINGYKMCCCHRKEIKSIVILFGLTVSSVMLFTFFSVKIYDLVADEIPGDVGNTTLGLPFHIDLCHLESPPGVTVLYCVR